MRLALKRPPTVKTFENDSAKCKNTKLLNVSVTVVCKSPHCMITERNAVFNHSSHQ